MSVVPANRRGTKKALATPYIARQASQKPGSSGLSARIAVLASRLRLRAAITTKPRNRWPGWTFAPPTNSAQAAPSTAAIPRPTREASIVERRQAIPMRTVNRPIGSSIMSGGLPNPAGETAGSDAPRPVCARHPWLFRQNHQGIAPEHADGEIRIDRIEEPARQPHQLAAEGLIGKLQPARRVFVVEDDVSAVLQRREDAVLEEIVEMPDALPEPHDRPGPQNRLNRKVQRNVDHLVAGTVLQALQKGNVILDMLDDVGDDEDVEVGPVLFDQVRE